MSFFAAREDYQALETLYRYTLKRHYPELLHQEENQTLKFFEKVIDRQIQLVIEWMRVGFIHGVMNTDNTALSGETIDYGPCAMLGIYAPQTVYSSIDRMGRYAFGNQPKILHWNMARLAECLLPLIDTNTDKAADQLAPALASLPARYEHQYTQMMARKLGLFSCQQEDKDLIVAVLAGLEDNHLDYTITFDLMTKALTSNATAFHVKHELGECFTRWQERLSAQNAEVQAVQHLMRRHNPLVIPRNHHIEEAIQECEQDGTTTLAERFVQVLLSPYVELAHTAEFQDPPQDGDKGYQTFCGT